MASDRNLDLLRAKACLASDEFAEAAGILEGLVRAEPTSIPLRSLLAETYFRRGDFDSCRQLIVAMQAAGFDTPLGRVVLAILDLMAGHADRSLEHLRRAEAAGNASAGVLELIGRLYLRLRRVTQGAYFLDKALALDPTRGSAHAGRAIAYLLADDPTGAEREAREALRLNPRAWGAQYHLGLALQRLNRTEEAIAAYKAAIVNDPRSVGAAHRRLADVFERRGEPAFASHHRALAHRHIAAGRRQVFDVEWFRQGLAQ